MNDDKIDGVNEIKKIPKVPVLFIIFNRLDIVKQVFEAIREYQPEELFIACDGARKYKENEQERIQEVQKYVLDNVDWKCKVETNFLKDNLSPARAVSSFLIWFFKKVEYGIVLEHDCFVERDFFDFCAELLIRYKENKRIVSISGFNVQGVAEDCEDSYYFSNTQQLWGWAAWRRSFDGYDIYLKDYSLKEFKQNIKDILPSKNEKAVFTDKFLSMKEKHGYNTWDMQLLYNMWRQKGLNIEPKYNLVSNIGFGTQAVNCKNPNHFLANNKIYNIMPLKHPKEIKVNQLADEKTYLKFWYKNKIQLIWRFFYRHLFMKRKF